ncbi:hypothetical protein AOA80_04740 [Methanomassiliicoccales archaeon RumEn M1]|jgi:predicted Fe-Mo cluster-binding NifX family protein|nr:hypothetical protein AOA80_04740 [Methanomassiliicoccales archaeon RumEn M1]
MTGDKGRVAISATGASIEGEMDHHFGRCRCFAIAEGEHMLTIENTARDASEGAGVKAAQLMIDNRVDVVITGSLGPKASQVLEEAGIRSFVGISGKVADVLERYRKGRLEASSGDSRDRDVQRKDRDDSLRTH